MAFKAGDPDGRVLNLRAGDLVEVRSVVEILETLDEEGRLEALPFMPEMLKFCGSRFRVFKRADKACDRIDFRGLRRMNHAVHLEGVRCDGQAHGGCQAGCLIYWKEGWLRRVAAADAFARTPDPPPSDAASPSPHAPAAQMCSSIPESLRRGTSRSSGASHPDEKVWSCQATDLNRATTSVIRLEDPRQYWNDVRSRNVTPAAAIRGLLIGLYNRFQSLSSRALPGWLVFRHGRRYPHLAGRLTKTPSCRLNLRPGELVEIRSKEEISRTLDTRNRNRGLSFDVEMLKFCGRRARVLRRVDRIIEESTGKMKTMGSDCIILEGVTCTGEYHRFCPRGIYPFWREIWLRRVEGPDGARDRRPEHGDQQIGGC